MLKLLIYSTRNQFPYAIYIYTRINYNAEFDVIRNISPDSALFFSWLSKFIFTLNPADMINQSNMVIGEIVHQTPEELKRITQSLYRTSPHNLMN